MEQRVPADEIGLLLEEPTALGLHRFQVGQALEPAVGEWLVGERPEVLGWLQFRGVGGQEQEMDALGDLHLLPGMPPGSIQHEGDPLGRSCSHVPGKGGQHLTEEDGLDGGQEPPLGLTGGGPDEATDIEPFVALRHRRTRPFADGCPHLSNQREQANAMLVGGPELDLGIRMRGPDRVYLVAELS